MINPVFSSKTDETRNILTVGIGKSSFSAIECMCREGLDYVYYLLFDPTNTDKDKIVQTIDSELDECKFLFLVCSLEDAMDFSLINSIVNRNALTLVQSFLLVIIPEKLNDAEDMSKIIPELTQLSKKINLVIPIRNDRMKTIVGKNTDSQRFCNSDYHTMWIVKTINSIAFVPGYICTDYSDVNLAIRNKGFGFFAMGESVGNYFDQHMCMESFNNLVSTKKGILENIVKSKYLLVFIDAGTNDLHLVDIMELLNYLYQDLNPVAIYAWNCNFYELRERVRVTIIGTGFSDVSQLI